MKTIQITLEPSSWDESQITATGLTQDGYAISSAVTTMKAAELPIPFLSIWHTMVEYFKADGLSDGERVCVMATVELVVLPKIDLLLENDEQSAETISVCEAVSIKAQWLWADGRQLPSQSHVIEDSSAIKLVKYLLTPESYQLKFLGNES